MRDVLAARSLAGWPPLLPPPPTIQFDRARFVGREKFPNSAPFCNISFGSLSRATLIAIAPDKVTIAYGPRMCGCLARARAQCERVRAHSRGSAAARLPHSVTRMITVIVIGIYITIYQLMVISLSR